ncbi:arylamine N-acetyltransferase 4 [Fusarium flagelliforme]|uniref:arylamine N-acetyltransferase 4 n=1 Tax=Fusarium flagelliforme TaxID=2675880 RepID=UPI001E8CD9C7|nr:arylamine N-acetyltransferase 4 [Fusarium flagelliforme]KAH7173291.1 arylamine N-acetyltransferase 4 [Fusarium flagelliforme]
MTSSYNQGQLSQFFNHINLPHALRRNPQPSLMFLKALHTHSLATFPYENLSLHYNASHCIDLDPQYLFRKMVTDNRGRGGFCMEIAILYNHVLRAIGFDAYTAGVRTRGRLEGVPRGDYPGWNHIVNIITFPDGSKYHSDVAFGGDGATIPMPLIDGLVHKNMGTQQIQLKRDWVPHQVHRTEETKLWIYQYRNSQDSEWNSFYSFPGVEFFALDWDVVNWWINSHPDSHQRRNVLTIKFLQRPVESDASFEGETEIYGKRMLVNGVVKENLGGKTKIIATCDTEQERIEVLEKYFQLFLTNEEKGGILGYVSELDGTAGRTQR